LDTLEFNFFVYHFKVAIGQHHKEEGRLQIIKILMGNGSPLESKSSAGWTVLIKAAFCGHVDIIMLLLSTGADMNACSEEGLTALMMATQVRVAFDYDYYL
jgi:ankyrin repeat protein